MQSHQSEVIKHLAALVSLENKRQSSEVCQLAPIRRLPVEILEEVFVYFCDTIQFLDRRTSCPPLKLAAVCGSWRDLAFSTSRLWTWVNIVFGRPPAPDRLTNIELLVNLVLGYSGNAPLHVDLRVSVVCAQIDAVVTVMKSAARHSYHWRHAFLALPEALQSELSPFVQDLPILETLIVWDWPLLYDSVNLAPKLRHVEFQMATPAADLRIPWDSIVTLRLKAHDVPYSVRPFTEILTCVNLGKNLQRLDIGAFVDFREAWDGVYKYTNHNMQSLILSDIRYPTVLAHVFTSLTLPRLTHFSLSSRFLPSHLAWVWTDTHLRLAENFLMRSLCAITSLTLTSMPIRDYHIIPLLQLLPSIEELSITQFYCPELFNVTDSLISSLCVPHSINAHVRPLLPKLREIGLTMHHAYSPSYKALVEFVKSRWLPEPAYASGIGVDCLKSVAFFYLGRVIGDEFYPLTDLREAGMKLTMSVMSLN